ncbi:I78 family peptidase inhibitor [Sphingomonas endophytica]|uniref:Peptidase inhibitor I78 n=1 Tax=Sphingomonas endophytica TaxID=869719 RepID=A0A147I6R0_9SPHN|nr:I78 family peptidase inhibitor [Sphingomonas endophytica]KTT74639.1 hypothetical protein NS334_04415 [Sphingomonas endophytica]
MRRAALLSLAAVLAGCAPSSRPATPVPPALPAAAPGVQCDANSAQPLIGQPAATAIAEAQRRSGARTVRRYVTGAALTMDFRPDRLNVETDGGGTIVRLACG